MGQTKETYFVRLLTKSTIDGRMARLQIKKLTEINQMVKDFDAAKWQPKLEEVAELFGRVNRDANGKVIRVESDYDIDDADDVEGDEGGGGGDDADNEESLFVGDDVPEGSGSRSGSGTNGTAQEPDDASMLRQFHENGYGIQDEF